jgi:hypothetical protein
MKSYTYEARDEKPTEEKPRGTAIFSARRLARQQTGFEQFMAVVLLFVSVIGSTIAGGGGVERWAAGQFILWTAVAAFALQCVLSYVQYVYCVQWTSWQYLVAVAVSLTLTLIGYWPLAHPWLVDVLIWARVPALTAPYWAGALLVIVGLGIDLFPERTFVAR